MIETILHILLKDAGEKPAGKAARSARAAELAAKAIDNMIEPAAPPEERGRHLTKGPLEFREHRVDLPKAKGK
jgi:hypothetical protein